VHAYAGPYPDASLGAVLSSRTNAFDYVLIQFYNNNYCEYGSNDNAVVSSFQQWAGKLAAAMSLVMLLELPMYICLVLNPARLLLSTRMQEFLDM